MTETALPAVNPTVNVVVITGEDDILWNGTPISLAQLETLFRQSADTTPEPELRYEPEPLASYDLAIKVIQVIKDSGLNKFGFVGNDKAPDDESDTD